MAGTFGFVWADGDYFEGTPGQDPDRTGEPANKVGRKGMEYGADDDESK